MKHLRIWMRLTKNAFSSFLSNRVDSLSYLLGKLLRFGFFLVLIGSLFEHTPTLAGYTKAQTLIFFLTFNVVDVLTSAFFRGIYFFKGDVLRGAFDGVLTKPVNALFYSLSRLTDLLDFIFLIPIIFLLVKNIVILPHLDITRIFSYLLLLFLGLIIATSIHIFSAAISLRTAESDNVIWLYREVVALGRFPPEILSSKLQIIFTYFLPVIVIVAFPVQALFGTLPLWSFFVSIVLALLFFGFSLMLWKHSLKFYSSASS